MSPDGLSAARWARDILQQNPLVLASETTGLDKWDGIVQIALIHSNGTVLLDTLVKPHTDISYEARRIHGITWEMVKNAPDWQEVSSELNAYLSAGLPVVIYNADYDVRMMNQCTAKINREALPWEKRATFHCAMRQYATFFGDWNDYRGNYAWQSRDKAMRQQQLPEPVAPAHSALGDCLRTLAVVRAMAGAAGEAVPE